VPLNVLWLDAASWLATVSPYPASTWRHGGVV